MWEKVDVGQKLNCGVKGWCKNFSRAKSIPYTIYHKSEYSCDDLLTVIDSNKLAL